MSNSTSIKNTAKKLSIFALLIVALSTAVYVNWQYNSGGGTVSVNKSETTAAEKYLGDAKYVNATVKSTNDYFSSARTKRDETLNKSLSELKEIIESVKSNDSAKTKASEEVTRLTKNSESEQSIESLIIAKGFEDCVAVIGEKNISIVVKCGKNGLLSSETKQIQDIVCSNSDFLSENIKIIEIK